MLLEPHLHFCLCLRDGGLAWSVFVLVGPRQKFRVKVYLVCSVEVKTWQRAFLFPGRALVVTAGAVHFIPSGTKLAQETAQRCSLQACRQTGNGPRPLHFLKAKLSGPVITHTAAHSPCVFASAFHGCVGRHEFNSRLFECELSGEFVLMSEEILTKMKSHWRLVAHIMFLLPKFLVLAVLVSPLFVYWLLHVAALGCRTCSVSFQR